MARGLYRGFYVVCLLLFLPVAYACTVIDDDGHLIRLTTPAQRIVSLAPDITEILFAIGAGHHVVGVISGSDYPSAAQQVLSVGSYQGLDLERIISLRPDLVVAWGHTFSRQLAILKKQGIPIYRTQPRHLEDVPRTMQHLGCLAGTAVLANQEATRFLRQIAVLRQQYQGQKPITLFYQIGSYSLMTINKDSWINQVITLCGGRNVFANAKWVAPEVTWEAVVAANPQVIVSDATQADWKKRWMRWQGVAAVKQDLLFRLSPDLIDRAGPRLVEGATQLCYFLQQARLANN